MCKYGAFSKFTTVAKLNLHMFSYVLGSLAFTVDVRCVLETIDISAKTYNVLWFLSSQKGVPWCHFWWCWYDLLIIS